MSSRPLGSPNFHAPRRFSLMSPTLEDGEDLESDRIPWLEAPCIVVLGEPGIGKSTEFKYQAALVAEGGHQVFQTDWRDWLPSKEDIFATLPSKGGLIEALKAGETVHWYVDALDEGRIKIEDAFIFLIKGLMSIGEDRCREQVRLRLSCRAQDWREHEKQRLTELYNSDLGDGCSVYTLQPLSKGAIRDVARAWLVEPVLVDQFGTALERRNVKELAGQPLLLEMLLRQFISGDVDLAANRTALYHNGIEHLLGEQNQIRRSKHPPKSMLDRRRAIAKALALRTVFCGLVAIGVRDQHDIDEQTVVADLAASDAERWELSETLDTALFTRTGKLFGFTHRSYAEYLAAEALADRLADQWPLQRITLLFPTTYGMPGALREVAAWLAGLSPQFRTWLISRDAYAAAHGDTILFTPGERRTVLEQLAKRRFKRMRWHNMFDRFHDLARAVPVETLRGLLDPAQSNAVRTMAIELAGAAERHDFVDDIAAVATDCREAARLRALAAATLAKMGPGRYLPILLPLLALPEEEDPNDLVAGDLLHELFPNWLSVSQALEALHFPRSFLFRGSYGAFWQNEFHAGVRQGTRAERQCALDAISALIARHENKLGIGDFLSLLAQLLLLELREEMHDPGRLARWLVTLAPWGYPSDLEGRVRIEQIHSWWIAHPSERHAVIDAILQGWPARVPFTRHTCLPFIEDGIPTDELDIWFERYRHHAQRADVAEELFQLLEEAVLRHQLSDIEFLWELARLSPAVERDWQSRLTCDIETNHDGIQFRTREANKRNELELEQLTAQRVQELAPLAATGDLRALDNLMRCFQTPVGTLPFWPEVEAHFGFSVRDDVQAGLRKAWESISDTSALWENLCQYSGTDVVPGYGYLLDKKGIDLARLAPPQIDYLLWLALSQVERFGRLVFDLWAAVPEVVWPRLRERLTLESAPPAAKRQQDGTPAWNQLAHIKGLVTASLLDRIEAMLLKEGLSENGRIMALSLRLLLLDNRHDSVAKLVAPVVERKWLNGARDHQPDLVSLAAWWVIAPAAAYEVLRQQVFVAPNWRSNLIDFVCALNLLYGHSGFFVGPWPYHISAEDYAALLPLFYDSPATDEETLPFEAGKSMEAEDEFLVARASLQSLISRGGFDQVSGWLNEWKEDPRYGVHQSVFASLLLELRQQRADETWVAHSQQELDTLFGAGVPAIRDADDFAAYVNELIDSRLKPHYRQETSPVPLLWKGTKADGRTRKSEKELQTALLSSLTLILDNLRGLVEAKEVEMHDQKKPDNRLSLILQDGKRVDLPIELKWDDHQQVWDSPVDQVLKRYMVDPKVTQAVYVVAWSGLNSQTPGPNGKKPASAGEMEAQLQQLTDERLSDTGKTITVHVIDASVLHD